jgi:hypothetical protein
VLSLTKHPNVLKKYILFCPNIKAFVNPLNHFRHYAPGLTTIFPLPLILKYHPEIIIAYPRRISWTQKQLTDYLDKGFITESYSSYAAPLLIAHKANGGLRMSIDFAN